MTLIKLNDFNQGSKSEYLMIIILISHRTIYCDPSSKPSRRDGSGERSDICFYGELTKNYL